MLINKKTGISTYIDISKTISIISSELSSYLADEIEELNVSSYQFRDGMNNALSFIFSGLINKKESILAYPDTIPGFTVMVFKKENIESEKKVNQDLFDDFDESGALNSVFSRFMGKNSNKVLVIENTDIIFAMFPVADTKKNLKDLGLYITF